MALSIRPKYGEVKMSPEKKAFLKAKRGYTDLSERKKVKLVDEITDQSDILSTGIDAAQFQRVDRWSPEAQKVIAAFLADPLGFILSEDNLKRAREELQGLAINTKEAIAEFKAWREDKANAALIEAEKGAAATGEMAEETL